MECMDQGEGVQPRKPWSLTEAVTTLLNEANGDANRRRQSATISSHPQWLFKLMISSNAQWLLWNLWFL